MENRAGLGAVFVSFIFVSGLFAASEPRVIELKTEKVEGAVHWMPGTVEVTQGEKVKIMAKHELEGGFDFHGLFIPELKISGKIERNSKKPFSVVRTIPKDMKPGEYKVGCQFHEKHVPATLVVKAKEQG